MPIAVIVLFVIGKLVLGFYLGRVATSSTYGAAGALIVVLLWVYYAAQILFLGAEFTQVYSRHLGSRIVPSEKAVPMTEKQTANQSSYPEGKGRISPEPLPWHAPERARLGSLGSLLLGLFLGIFYGFRRKRPQ
jgi:hypothetical protein